LPDNEDSSAEAKHEGAARPEIERVRADKDFTRRAKCLLERDKELLERLAE
jgi:hypothetical protein